MSDLHDHDVVLWSEQQADLIRRFAAGERVNTAELDWANIAEEIESVGSEQRHAVGSLLRQALTHLLKLQAWPETSYTWHWRTEARTFLDDARARFVPSMRQRIDIADIYRRARRALPHDVDGIPPLPVPEACPMTLDELLSVEP
jgi:hypothetical protein